VASLNPWRAFNESRGREGYLMPDLDLVKTGIKGLDDILFGGIPRPIHARSGLSAVPNPTKQLNVDVML